MKNYPLWKSLIVFLVIFSGIIFSIPSILYQEDTENWFLENKINLGLDLQGGSYLLLEVQSDVLFKEELENISDSIRLISRNFQINLTDINIQDDQISFRFMNSLKLEDIRKEFIKNSKAKAGDLIALISDNISPQETNLASGKLFLILLNVLTGNKLSPIIPILGFLLLIGLKIKSRCSSISCIGRTSSIHIVSFAAKEFNLPIITTGSASSTTKITWGDSSITFMGL